MTERRNKTFLDMVRSFVIDCDLTRFVVINCDLERKAKVRYEKCNLNILAAKWFITNILYNSFGKMLFGYDLFIKVYRKIRYNYLFVKILRLY